jgi:hypothetical protein
MIENEFHARGLIVIVICDDPWYRLTREMVREAAGRWLGVPPRDIGVDFFPLKGFMLLLPSTCLHDRALDNNFGLIAGQAKIQLLPWTRLAGADACKLSFKVRLCIEGIPFHARQESTVRQLLPQRSLLEAFDRDFRNDAEAQCCCVTIWTRDLNAIAMEGVLRLEELQDRPQVSWHITDPSTVDPQCPRVGPVQSLGYELIIHVDPVIDYRPLSASSVDCLERHSFRWCLGHWDDWSRVPPHHAILDRMGPHKKDCPPSGGTEGEPSHRRDRAGEPHHQGPGPHGPCQQKCQWVPTRGSRGPANQGATLLELIPS